jgi:hypothetical protein
MLDEDAGAGRPAPDRGGAPEALVLDLLNWLSPAPRPYAEVMERWRTSCPRLTVWEDVVDRGLVARTRMPPAPAMVGLTAAGCAVLDGRPSSR